MLKDFLKSLQDHARKESFKILKDFLKSLQDPVRKESLRIFRIFFKSLQDCARKESLEILKDLFLNPHWILQGKNHLTIRKDKYIVLNG